LGQTTQTHNAGGVANSSPDGAEDATNRAYGVTPAKMQAELAHQISSSSAARRLALLITTARAAIIWDQVWPILVRFLCVVALFLASAWFGLWLVIPGLTRGPLLAGFAVLGVAALWPLINVFKPSRASALTRIDTSAAHRPATTAADALALGSADAATQRLWAAHRERAVKSVMILAAPMPRPGLSRLDPRAWRAAALLAAVAGLFVAGPEWRARIDMALDWRGTSAGIANVRLDSWIDPPLYTRQPPVMLDMTADAEGRGRTASVRAPVGSVLVVRAAGEAYALETLMVEARGGLKPVPSSGVDSSGAPQAVSSASGSAQVRETRLTLAEDGRLSVSLGGHRRSFVTIAAIPDLPPTIVFSGTPVSEGKSGLAVAYIAKDDYGLAALEGLIAPDDIAAIGRALVPPPRPVLTAPIDATSGEVSRTIIDVSDSPWAGARVRLTLMVRDEAGQEGRSDTISVTLPQRTFTKPLAKALVELRRDLIVDRENRRRVQIALDALMIAPDIFTPSSNEYLGLSIGSTRLRVARNDADLIEVAEFLWGMALRLEDGDLSDLERDLRAAQEALRQALERGADRDEIRKLTQDLRQAMDKFLREFAEQQRRNERENPQQSDQQNQRNQASRSLTPQDLNRMLNRMEEMARNGDTAEAQRLLDQLNQILNNLQTARPNRNMDQRSREMSRALNELDAMTRDQQDLRDETFRQDGEQAQPQNRRRDRMRQGQQRDGQSQAERQPNNRQGQNQRQNPGQNHDEPQNGESDEQGDQQPGQGQQPRQGQGQGQQQGQSLAERQQRLRERVDGLRQRMQRGGGQNGQQLNDTLGEAEESMRQAERGLGQGDSEGALAAQERALDALRKGAQNLAQQMQPGEGEGEGTASDDPGQGQPGRAANNGQENDDPLGRPTRNPHANDNARFNRQGGRSGLELRVEEVIRELRRRLGDPSRPREELDYFERLLRPR
jgi:uncharacterized protein (TIGR02302 family)